MNKEIKKNKKNKEEERKKERPFLFDFFDELG